MVPRKAVIQEPKAVRALRDFRDLTNQEMCSGAAMQTYGSCILMLLAHWKVNPPTTERRWLMFDEFKPKLGRPRKDCDPGGYLRSRTS